MPPRLVPSAVSDLPQALGLVATTWGILAAAPFVFAGLGLGLGLGGANLLAFGLCSAVALAGLRPPRAIHLGTIAAIAAGLGLGWALLPSLAETVGRVGSALGMPDPIPAGGGRGAALLLATVVLAPLFEEIVYRERLLPALTTRIGIAPALILSSAAFALPHPTPWATLGSFSAGLVLGSTMLVGRSLALCVGMHAGFNLRLAGFSMESL